MVINKRKNMYLSLNKNQVCWYWFEFMKDNSRLYVVFSNLIKIWAPVFIHPKAVTNLRNTLYYILKVFYMSLYTIYRAGICLLKVNNRNTRTRCETCSKLTIKTPDRHHWRCSGVFIVNSEHISHLVLVLLSLILNM